MAPTIVDHTDPYINSNYPTIGRTLWYSLHPIEFYRILKQSPHLAKYIRTMNVWPSEDDKGYNENLGEVFSYLLKLPTWKLAFHKFHNGLPHYIMDHLENTFVTDLDFSGVRNFQVNTLVRLTPLRRLGLATIDTQIVNPICDLEFNLKVQLETLVISFAGWPSAEKYYHWFLSPACSICVTSIISLELTGIWVEQLLKDTSSTGREPIYWLFMALLNIRNLSIQMSDAMYTGDDNEKLFKPYPRPFNSILDAKSLPANYLDTDLSNYGAFMTTSGLESLKNLQTLTFAGTFYDLWGTLTKVRAGRPVRNRLLAFRHLLQSLKQSGSPSAVTTVTFLMDFDYSPVFNSVRGPLNLPVLSEWQGVVDMLLSQAHMPNLGKVVFTIGQLPIDAKEGDATRIKEAFSALSDIRRLIDKNMVVWKD